MSTQPIAPGTTPSSRRARGPTPVARVEELHGPGPFALSADGVDVVVVRTPAGLRAYEGRCPHQGALLGEGEMQGDTLVCRNHGWRFNAATGGREGGPQCLRACPLLEHEGVLLADLSALRERGPHQARRAIAQLPGPRGRPIAGSLPELNVPHMHRVLERWAEQHGPVFRFRFGPRTVLGIAEPGLIEEVLRARPEGFSRYGAIKRIFTELGVHGVFSAEGDAWRPQRRLTMEALSQRHLRGFYPTLRRTALRLRSRVAGHSAGAAIDIADDFRRFTVDVTTQLALGYDVDTLERENDPIHGRIAQIFPTLTRRLNSIVPYWRWVRLPRDRRVDRAISELRAWLSDLLDQARTRLAADPARPPANFMEAMLTATDEEGHPFSDDAVFGNLIEILVAGEDTTANTLAFAVHHLCDHPDVVARMRAESDDVFAGDVAPADLDALRRLHWTAAVASETMRLRPVAPFLVLESVHDVVVGNIAVPRGTGVFVLLRPPARSGAHFGAPDEFRPERWRGGAAPLAPHQAQAHMPFGTGPRICPGRSLALVELSLVLSVLYHAFDFERVGAPDDVREHFAFTMSPVGLRVSVRERGAPAAPARPPAAGERADRQGERPPATSA